MNLKKLLLTIIFIILLFIQKTNLLNAQTSCSAIPTNTGTVIFSTTTTAGSYRVWSRMKSADLNNNSFYLKIDDNCAVLVGDSSQISTSDWTWVDYQNGNISTKIDVTLGAGSHVITLIGNEPGVVVDKIFLTKNLSCVPVNFGNNCTVELPTPTASPTSVVIPTQSIIPTSASATLTPIPTPTNTPVPQSQNSGSGGGSPEHNNGQSSGGGGGPGSSNPSSASGGSGNGLVGAYYLNRSLRGRPKYRTDSNLDFNWLFSSPMAGIPADNFSVRWAGYILPPEWGRYTFYVNSDDGVRVWVNNRLIINRWYNHSALEFRGALNLLANKKYSIRVDYYDNKSTAYFKLSWSGPSISKTVIPQGKLYTYR